jgi:predicted P-loop ATPase
VRHKLENARDKSDLPTGIAPEGFGEGLVKAPVPDERGYTHIPGHNAALSECKKTSLSDLVQALCVHPEWAGVLRYDTFRRRPVATRPPMALHLESQGLSNTDITRVRTWFESKGINVGHEECGRAIDVACGRTEFHPVKEYLASVGKGDAAIIQELATLGLGSVDPKAPDILRKFLVSAVRRILRPGCQVDTMPVLVGRQGARKTSFVRSLFGQEWCRSQMPDLATKDASGALAGFWGIELAELDRVLKAETSTVKEFLTRTFDDYRPPYGRADLRFPRECVFVGTVNEREFLRDSTGSRRFWPLTVERASTDWVAEHRDAIWAAAVALEEGGVAHWFEDGDETALEAMREPFIETDAWHEKIAAYCAGKDWLSGTVEIFTTAIGGKLEQMGQREKNRIGATLRRLGCTPLVKRVNGNCVRGWSIPKPVAEGIKSRPAWMKLV